MATMIWERFEKHAGAGKWKMDGQFFLDTFRYSFFSFFHLLRDSIPNFRVYDHDDNTIYIIKPPTCCGGLCIDCCTEGAPCPHGCFMLPWRVYEGDAKRTTGDAPYIGKMLKIRKASCCDTFNETSYVELKFPEDADETKKGLLLGAYLLINALFFEHSE